MKNLRIAIILTSLILIAEIAGGIISGSLALLSDAGHVFMDLLAIGLAWFTLKLSYRPATSSRTFGYHRTEIFAALINGITLVGICLFIFYEAYKRIAAPSFVESKVMLIFALVGLAVNIWVMFKFRGYADLNMRGVFLHALGDTLSSIVVVFGAISIAFTGLYIIDPILSILIGVIILFSSFRLLSGSIHILLEGAPKGVDVDEIINALTTIEQIKGVHDVHIWSICSNVHLMTAHILADDVKVSQAEQITEEASTMLKKFGIAHTTFQFEHNECGETKLHDIKH